VSISVYSNIQQVNTFDGPSSLEVCPPEKTTMLKLTLSS
jgi:hypothetical protein